MADGHRRHEWQQTSSILCLIANVNRDPKKGRPLKPSDFDPTAPKGKPLKISIRHLKESFS